MSQFSPALSFLLDNEDRQRAYAIVPDAGGEAISGINSNAWPADFKRIAALPQPERAPRVAEFYFDEFWSPMKIAFISSQDLANRVLDAGVNAGSTTSSRMLQEAANTLGADLETDGILGPKSVAAINAIEPNGLLDAFRQLRVQHYRDIADADPAKAQYLAAWEARANR